MAAFSNVVHAAQLRRAAQTLRAEVGAASLPASVPQPLRAAPQPKRGAAGGAQPVAAAGAGVPTPRAPRTALPQLGGGVAAAGGHALSRAQLPGGEEGEEGEPGELRASPEK